MESKQTQQDNLRNQFLSSEMKNVTDMMLTNDEFFKQSNCMYFTDEVTIRIEGEQKFVNEFQVMNSIGKGGFSKVKRVIRRSQQKQDEEEEEMQFAMKIMHKPSLKRERAIRYNTEGEMQMIHNYDKVQMEIEIWTQLNHPYIAKLFEMIDDDSHDYLYLVLEYANMGQIATWNPKLGRYERNEAIYNFVLEHLRMHNVSEEIQRPQTTHQVNEAKSGEKQDSKVSAEKEKAISMPPLELVAQYLFRQLVSAVMHLHDRANVIHRDIKPENILFCGETAQLKLTDFSVSRNGITEGVRLYDSEGTCLFTAPECHIVEKNGYEPKPTDIWSLGICLYAYVNDGVLPFYGESELEIQIASKQNELIIPKTFSPQLQEVIGLMLNKDPKKRPTAEELLGFTFFATD